MVAKEPDLLAVLHRGLAILEWCQVLEWTVDSHAEKRRLVRQVPVDIVCGWFLCGEPVVVVMLGLAYAPLLELVAVPETNYIINSDQLGKDSVCIDSKYPYLSTLDFSSHSS